MITTTPNAIAEVEDGDPVDFNDVAFFETLCKTKGIAPNNAKGRFELAMEVINQKHGIGGFRSFPGFS